MLILRPEWPEEGVPRRDVVLYGACGHGGGSYSRRSTGACHYIHGWGIEGG